MLRMKRRPSGPRRLKRAPIDGCGRASIGVRDMCGAFGSWVQPGSLAQHSLVLNGEAGATESCAAPPALLPQPPLAA